MQIQLRQTDIEAAIRQYLAGKNIATAGESISIVFTAGRKAGGLTAAVTIGEEAPAAVQVTETTKVPADTLVASTQPVQVVETTAAQPVSVATTNSPATISSTLVDAATVAGEPATTEASVTTAAPAEATTAAVETKPTTSLFS